MSVISNEAILYIGQLSFSKSSTALLSKGELKHLIPTFLLYLVLFSNPALQQKVAGWKNQKGKISNFRNSSIKYLLVVSIFISLGHLLE